jgi:crotonobetainyl-CoA:carnitine CoA-transferase CaiB-like acyl-CoA transferase
MVRGGAMKSPVLAEGAAERTEGMLSGYRILDLTNERGPICAKILGDLGADVIKVEKPGGDSARTIGPFYHDVPHPEKSLFWLAYNTSKRGITLDIETLDGRAIFRRLVEKSDIVVESFDPGYMDKLGLGYGALSRINPRIILTSITGFGQTGPYHDFKAPDWVVWALSGVLFIVGDPDRPPLAPGFPLSYLFGGMQAAVGTMIALYHKEVTGHGQSVDVSAQMAASIMSQPEVQGVWDIEKRITHRLGRTRERPGTMVRTPLLWQCKDGDVSFIIMLGASTTRSNALLAEWIEADGVSSETFRKIDWQTLGWDEMKQDLADEVIGVISRFFMRHTKAELFQGCIERGISLCPLLTPKDLLEFEQLVARSYWVALQHPEPGMTITYPGGFLKSTGTVCEVRRPPLIGEHNEEIYAGELGLSIKELSALRQSKII